MENAKLTSIKFPYKHIFCKNCGGVIMMPQGSDSYICDKCHADIPYSNIVAMNITTHMGNEKTGIIYPLVNR